MADDSPKKNDIDFDELDKAVNSLMGTVGSETLEDSEKTKTLDVNSTLKDGEKPLYGALEKVAESIGHETLATDGEVELHEDLTHLPDVMPPDLSQVAEESAHTKVETVQEAEKPEPEAEVAHEETPAPTEDTKPAEEEKPAVEAEQKPADVADPPKPAVKRPNSGRFMDMVHPKADMRGATTPAMPELIVPERRGMIGAAAEPVKVAAVAAPAPKVVVSPAEPVVTAEATQTPFLPDAKVEKRPLGSSAPTGGSIAVSFADEKKSEELAQEDEKEEKPVETEPINSENVKVDDGSGDEQRALNASDFNAESETEKALTQIEASEVNGEGALPTIEKVESGDTESLKAPKKPTYEEVVKSDKPGTNAAGAIYDTKEYHQPIAHPAKQKSGWSTVLIIVIIIVLAVAIAGGAYLYFGMK